MDLEIKHTIEDVKIDSTGFKEVMDAFAGQMESLIDGLKNTGYSGVSSGNENSGHVAGKIPPVQNESKQNFQGVGSPNSNESTKLISTLTDVATKLGSLVTKIEQQNRSASYDASSDSKVQQRKALNDLNLEYDRKSREYQRSHNREERNERNDEQSERSWRRFGKGMLLGAGTAMAYQAGGFGATEGSSYGAINTSASDYMAFQRDLYNQRIGNITNTAGTAMSLGATGLGSLLGGMMGMPSVGAAIGMGVGGIGNYYINKWGGERKSQNELALNADMDSWRIQQMGLSGVGAGRMNGSYIDDSAGDINFTKLQDRLYNSRNAAFSKDATGILLGARRDMVYGMRTSSGELDYDKMADYSTGIQKAAMQTGMDKNQLNQIVGNYSAFTKEDPVKALNKLVEVNQKYGGDTVGNTAKMLQIMTSTPMGSGNAESLVNRYQYNDAILSNRVNASLSSPLNRLKGRTIGKAWGLSGEEMSQLEEGVVPDRLQREYRAAQKSHDPSANIKGEVLGQIASLFGVNIQANDIGGVNPQDVNRAISGKANDLPESFKAYSDNILKALGNINTINATSPTIIISDGVLQGLAGGASGAIANVANIASGLLGKGSKSTSGQIVPPISDSDVPPIRESDQHRRQREKTAANLPDNGTGSKPVKGVY